MKVLVTGAAGFLGRHIVDYLQKKKYQIVTVVRPTSDVRYLVEKNVELIHGDLRDESCVQEAMKDVDAVVHAAAALRGKWQDFYDVNVGVTKNLLEQAAKQKVKRFVFISSIIVYDHSSSEADTVFSEEMPYEQNDQTFYCKTKIQAEELIMQYHKKHKLPTVILRPAALYGKHGPLFVSRLGLAMGDNRYLVFGNGGLPLVLSYVEGVAEAVYLALTKKEALGRVYNVTEDHTITQNEFVAQIRSLVQPKFRAWKMPYWLARTLGVTSKWLLGLVGAASPLNLSYMRLCVTPFRYSNAKIKKELGWQPQSDFRDSIRGMMLWHKEKRQPRRKLPGVDSRVPIVSTKTLNVGVVGCGVISGPHLQALQRIRNARIVALCDPVEEARLSVARKYGVANTYSDYREMLKSEALDAVHVCTPAQTHAEISLGAMQAGCHVLVEKPMALNTTEARKMMQAAEKHGLKLCIGHNHVYDRVMIRARNLLASDAVGRVAFVEALYGNSFSSNPSSQYMSYSGKDNWAYGLPGMLYQNFISHPISLMLDVLGDARITHVHVKYHRVVPHMKTDELYVALENDESSGLLRLSNAVSPRYFTLSIYGTDGTLRIDFLNRYLFLDKPMAKLPRVIGRSVMAFWHAKALFGASCRNAFAGLFGKYNLYQGNETLIRLFYRSILFDEPSPISPQEGLRSMEIMDEVWQRLQNENGASPMTQMPKKRSRRVTKKSATKASASSK